MEYIGQTNSLMWTQNLKEFVLLILGLPSYLFCTLSVTHEPVPLILDFRILTWIRDAYELYLLYVTSSLLVILCYLYFHCSLDFFCSDSHSLYLSLVLVCQYRKVKLEKHRKERKTKAGCGTHKKR